MRPVSSAPTSKAGAVAQTPLGRIGQPDDIASIAVFLASDDSYWLTGEQLSPAAACADLARKLARRIPVWAGVRLFVCVGLT